LRSPRDKPLRSLMDVLLDALGYQARQPHQEDVSTSSTDALRGVTRVRVPAPTVRHDHAGWVTAQ
jgi:hypothetical protein